jgi:hypothetical protein
MDNVNRLSITKTVQRQTPKTEFGQVLKNTLTTGANLAGKIVGGIAGMPIVSAAVSSVSAMAGGSGSSAGRTSGVAQAATGIVNVGPSGGGTASVSSGGGAIGTSGVDPTVTAYEPNDMNGMISAMRAESDRSMALQMSMQQESRDYNTLSNVIKVRHDSAKAAINNIR